MAEKVINIGGRFHDTSINHTVTGANEILDDDLQKKQSVINAEQLEHNQESDNRIEVLENTTVRFTPQSLTEGEQERARQNISTYSKDQVNNIVSRTPETDIKIVNVPEGTDIATYLSANVPEADRPNNLFRVPGPGNHSFSEWAWDGTQWIMLDEKDYGIDDEAIDGSQNLITSRGVYELLPKENASVEGDERDGFIKPNGDIGTASDYIHYYFEINSGNPYHIHVPSFTQNSELTICYFIFAEREGGYNVSAVPGSTITTNTTLDLDVMVPSEAIAIGVISREELSTGIPTVTYKKGANVEDYVEGYVAGVTNPMKDCLRTVYKDIYILENHCVEHNGSSHPLKTSNEWDVLVMPIPECAIKIVRIDNLGDQYMIDVFPDDNFSLWEDGSHFLGSQVDLGLYPTGKFFAISAKKSSNPNGYDNVIVNWKYNFEKSDYFILKQRAVTTDGSIGVSFVEEMYATDFLPISGKNTVELIGGWSGGSNVSLAFYDVNRKFISYITDANITIEPEDFPEGAAFIRATAWLGQAGTHAILGIDNASVIHNINEITPDIVDNKTALLEKTITPQTVTTILRGQLPRYYDGNPIYNSNMDSYVWDNIDPSNTYCAKGFSIPSSSYGNVAFVHYYHDDTWITREYFVEVGPYNQIKNVTLNVPSNCNKILICSQVNTVPSLSIMTIGNRIDSQDLKDDIDSLKSEGGKMMKVVKSGNTIYIRTAFNADKDIIMHFGEDGNACMKPVESWLGANILSDSDLMSVANRFHDWNDSNAPIYNSNRSPWHLFANHGYRVPCMNTVESQLTSEDEGSIWTDQLNREYTLGLVTTTYVVLLPKIIINPSDPEGIYTRSWEQDQAWPTELNHVYGAVHTARVVLNGAAASNYQIKPIQESVDRRFVADGAEIAADGTYYCDDLSINETLIGLNPLTTTTWFPTPVRESEMIRLLYSYNIHGVATRFDVVIDVKYPIMAEFFGANQAQHNETVDGYDIYVFAPRSKYEVAGHRTDVPFKNNPSDGSSRSIVCTRNNTDCYDKNKMPDRLISYLQKTSDGSKLIGFASGLSLTRGVSKDSERINYIPENSMCFYDSIGQANKMYISAISADNYPDGLLPDTLTAAISTYFTYWDPNANSGQVFWYKDGRNYVVYAHYQEAHDKVVIKLPKEMEGLSVSVVDSVGVTPLTDIVENGKIYVNAIDSNHNYIVLKIE